MTATAGDEIRLTDSSYVTGSIADSPWCAAFRQDLAIAKAVFWVGYSIADLDIARLIASTEQLGEKSFFIVGQNPSTRTIKRATTYGTVQYFDAAWFGRQIESKRRTYTPMERLEPSWYCLAPYSVPIADTTAVSDRAVFDLFLLGLLDLQLLWNSLEGVSQPYIVPRTAGVTVLQLSKDASKVVAVHGGLGNGKTLLIEAVKARGAKEGIRVFSLLQRSPALKEELSALASLDSPFLLVIDDYPSWLDAIEFIGMHQNERMFIVVDARSSAHDVAVEQLEDLFPGRSIDELSVDQLQLGELESINDLLALYGLWGNKAGLSPNSRLRYLARL